MGGEKSERHSTEEGGEAAPGDPLRGVCRAMEPLDGQMTESSGSGSHLNETPADSGSGGPHAWDAADDAGPSHRPRVAQGGVQADPQRRGDQCGRPDGPGVRGPFTRATNSSAAFRVNVSARMRRGSKPRSTIKAKRLTRVRVLPVSGPARTSWAHPQRGRPLLAHR